MGLCNRLGHLEREESFLAILLERKDKHIIEQSGVKNEKRPVLFEKREREK